MIDVTFYYPALTAPYKGWSDRKLVTGTQAMVNALDGNEYFTTIAAEVTAFSGLVTTFTNKVAAASSRDSDAIIAKDLARLELISATLNLGNSVAKVANGDIQVLASSRMPLRKRRVPVVLEAPVNLTLVPGNPAGSLKVSVNRVKGASSYLVNYAAEPVTPESVWASAVSTSRNCTLYGLQSGAKYSVVVAAVGAKEQLMWGAPQQSPYIP